MLIWTTRFSRKKAVICVLIMGVVMTALILLVGHRDSQNADMPLLTDNAQRIAYLESYGWQVEPEPLETLQFLLPNTLTESYLAYNRLQKEQGFDLTGCCGKQVTRYTYALTNYPDRPDGVQLNLYVCENLPVAGDVCCPGADGFQATLQYPQAETE